jgi:hypothetical protein
MAGSLSSLPERHKQRRASPSAFEAVYRNAGMPDRRGSADGAKAR